MLALFFSFTVLHLKCQFLLDCTYEGHEKFMAPLVSLPGSSYSAFHDCVNAVDFHNGGTMKVKAIQITFGNLKLYVRGRDLITKIISDGLRKLSGEFSARDTHHCNSFPANNAQA